ncbi:MAG TPA: DUF1707 domain-containing protein [Solirubrobacteraceae bacterium]|nr:DUF1707 domain-containing protein [Solirubrobacteraceae bacterium]
MRLNDADRERIAEVLARHAAAGALSIEELEARVEALYRARSHTEAAALTADLPPLPPEQGGPPRGRGRGRGHGHANTPGPGWLATNERFRDPGTQRVMRVWVDAATGERHYVPDEDR